MSNKLQSRKTRELPVTLREAEIASFDPEKRTAKMIFSKGSQVKRYTWDGEYYEELSLDPKHVRLDRVRQGVVPFLKDHGGWGGASVDDVLGRVTEASVDGKKGEADVLFSERDDVQPIVRDIQNGILRAVSVGYVTHKMEKVGERDGIPILRATDWEVFEISCVAMPADPMAQFRSADGKVDKNKVRTFSCEVVENETEVSGEEKTVERNADLPQDKNNQGDKTMTEQEKKDMELRQQQEKLEQEKREQEKKDIAAKATEAEKTRIQEIQKAVRVAKLPEAFGEKLVSDKVSIEDARTQIISELEKQDKDKETRSMNITAGEQDEVQTRKDAMAEAILHRGDKESHKLTDLGRPFAGLSLVEMARNYLYARGVKDAHTMSAHVVAKRAFHSSSDFPEILANVMGKSLRKAYATSGQTFEPFVNRTTKNDFKEISRLQLGMGSSLAELGENGDVTYGTMSESAEKYKIKRYGKGVKVGYEMLVNDDLEAFVRVPGNMGAKAMSLESDLVWGIIIANAALADTFALFSSQHGNLAGAGAAIGITTLGAGRSAMRVQKEPDGEPLNLISKFLIVPTTLETVAEQYISQIQPQQASNANPFGPGGRSALGLIVEPRLDAASLISWYMSASKDQIDMIELAGLLGSEEPQISSERDFDSDGMKVKVVHAVGAKAIDFRGLYKNPGA